MIFPSHEYQQTKRIVADSGCRCNLAAQKTGETEACPEPAEGLNPTYARSTHLRVRRGEFIRPFFVRMNPYLQSHFVGCAVRTMVRGTHPTRAAFIYPTLPLNNSFRCCNYTS